MLEGADGAGALNPFRPLAPIRAGLARLRRFGGASATLSFAAAPVFDSQGQWAGARGFGCDVTEDERRRSGAVIALRRLQTLESMIWRLRQEVLAGDMINAGLAALAEALGANGAAIAAVAPARPQHREGDWLNHRVGPDLGAFLAPERDLLAAALERPLAAALEHHEVLAVPCFTRFRAPDVLVLWRASTPASWDAEDLKVAASGSALIRILLEHDALQEELANQGRSDSLTGLLNRRAFLDELARRIDRLEREDLPGTLMIIDLDGFSALNAAVGLEGGDAVLCTLSGLLRGTFRPTDLLGRLGGDEFAVWLDGADHLAAAERAEILRSRGVRELAPAVRRHGRQVSFSIGIGTRWSGSGEEIDALVWRVDRALRETKQNCRGGWGVSRAEPT